jgi:hypothetical protein
MLWFIFTVCYGRESGLFPMAAFKSKAYAQRWIIGQSFSKIGGIQVAGASIESVLQTNEHETSMLSTCILGAVAHE